MASAQINILFIVQCKNTFKKLHNKHVWLSIGCFDRGCGIISQNFKMNSTYEPIQNITLILTYLVRYSPAYSDRAGRVALLTAVASAPAPLRAHVAVVDARLLPPPDREHSFNKLVLQNFSYSL